MLQLLCWTWNCAIQLTSECFGSAKFQWTGGWNIVRCTEFLRILFGECHKELKLDICHQVKVSAFWYDTRFSQCESFIITQHSSWQLGLVNTALFFHNLFSALDCSYRLTYSNTATQKYVELTETPLKFGLRSNNIGFYYTLTKYKKPENAPDHTRLSSLCYMYQSI